MVGFERHIGDAVTTERRYFIASLPLRAQQLAAGVHTHWDIENRLH